MDTDEGDKVEAKLQVDKLFRPFAEKMQKSGLNPVVIDTFRHYYSLLVAGETGQISKTDIDPVSEGDIADAQGLCGLEEIGQRAAEKTVIIKLNGGLGTSMGLSKTKSLLEVRKGLSFLDITARQVLSCRQRSGGKLPVVFMNSFATEADTLKALSAYKDLAYNNIPLSFLQHKFPRILQDGLVPATWPEDLDLEWNPPGHGDIYIALADSGILQKLLDADILYAFISNVDNLGAIMDENILGYFAKSNFPFMMEVAHRSEADTKGGHLATKKGGGFALREIAQCPQEELGEFQDIATYKYFNTNTIWINLKALRELLEACGNIIPLPMIRNPKTIDSKDESSPPVYQLETAMGSAISLFDRATAIRVPRSRFIPVKKCEDLLGIWSDAYLLSDDYHIVSNPDRQLDMLAVHLDDKYYKRIDQFKSRFPHGAPSLLECLSLDVRGDIVFGKGVQIKGNVVITNDRETQMTIPDGTTIEI